MRGGLFAQYAAAQRRRRWLIGWLVGSAITVAVVCASHLGYLDYLDFAWLDALMAVSPPSELAHPIKMVTATDADFAAAGGPVRPAVFPRRLLARVIERLAVGNAGVICVDILLDSPADRDDELERALRAARDAGVPVILACAFADPGGAALPLGRFRAHASLGAVDVGLGPHREVRTLQPWIATADRPTPSMAVAAYEALRRRGLLSGPPPPQGPLLLRFRPTDRAFARYPAADVAAGRIPHTWLRGVAVMVGRMDRQAGDWHVVPVPGEAEMLAGRLVEMPGVEVQAHCLAALLSRRPPARTSPVADVATGVLAAALAAWAVEAWGVGYGAAIIVVVLLGGGLLASAVSVGSTGYVVNFMPAVVSVLVYAQVHGSVARRRLARSLGQLVGRDLLRRVGDLQPQAGMGDVADVAVLVFDLRGTTEMAADAPPLRVGSAINDLLAAVGRCVLEHGGAVNKFLGDGVLALFSPALGCRQAPKQAIQAAQAMCRQLGGEMADRWEERTGMPLRYVIAVHAGRAWMGFVGLTRRLEMTALGNVVNTAFELERAAKEHGHVLLVSADAMREAGLDASTAWEPVQVSVRGAANTLLCYTWCESKGLSGHETDAICGSGMCSAGDAEHDGG